jgi:hypothetical protein
VLRNFCVEANFLATLQLHHSTIVDHQLDLPEPDRSQRLPKLPKQRWRQWQLVI